MLRADGLTSSQPPRAAEYSSYGGLATLALRGGSWPESGGQNDGRRRCPPGPGYPGRGPPTLRRRTPVRRRSPPCGRWRPSAPYRRARCPNSRYGAWHAVTDVFAADAVTLVSDKNANGRATLAVARPGLRPGRGPPMIRRLTWRPRRFVGVHQAAAVSNPSSVAGRVGDFQRAETYLARPEGRRAPGGTRCVRHGPRPATCR